MRIEKTEMLNKIIYNLNADIEKCKQLSSSIIKWELWFENNLNILHMNNKTVINSPLIHSQFPYNIICVLNNIAHINIFIFEWIHIILVCTVHEYKNGCSYFFLLRLLLFTPLVVVVGISYFYYYFSLLISCLCFMVYQWSITRAQTYTETHMQTHSYQFTITETKNERSNFFLNTTFLKKRFSMPRQSQHTEYLYYNNMWYFRLHTQYRFKCSFERNFRWMVSWATGW